ncbi:MAG: hypothetical protein U0230_02415 [Polyangiales bacterium]
MHSFVSLFARPSTRLLVTLALVATPLAASAQPPAGGPPGRGQAGGDPSARMEARLAELTQRLSLTPQQQTQARQIQTETRAELDALRQSAQGSANPRQDPALRARFREIRWRAEDRLWALLSCEQKDRLRILMREKRAERMERRMQQGPHGGHGHGGRGGRGPHGQARPAGGPQASADIVEDGDDEVFGI